jgi:hypothetical protein
VQFGVEYLTLYYIRVGGYAESGTGQVHVQYTPIFVENDFCYNPIPLSYNVPYNGSNRCAITDGDPTPCGQIYHDLWFTIDPPLNTTTAIGLCNASFDSRIAIYHTLTGCGPSLEVICDDNSCANGNDAVVTFFRPAIDDGGYVVRIGGATLSDEGTFTMNPIHN